MSDTSVEAPVAAPVEAAMSPSESLSSVALSQYEDISGEFVKGPSASLATLPSVDEDVDTGSEDSEEEQQQEQQQQQEEQEQEQQQEQDPDNSGVPLLSSAIVFGGLLLAGLAAYLKLSGHPMDMQNPYASRDFF
jgi:hypothetical protein